MKDENQPQKKWGKSRGKRVLLAVTDSIICLQGTLKALLTHLQHHLLMMTLRRRRRTAMADTNLVLGVGLAPRCVLYLQDAAPLQQVYEILQNSLQLRERKPQNASPG